MVKCFSVCLFICLCVCLFRTNENKLKMKIGLAKSTSVGIRSLYIRFKQGEKPTLPPNQQFDHLTILLKWFSYILPLSFFLCPLCFMLVFLCFFFFGTNEFLFWLPQIFFRILIFLAVCLFVRRKEIPHKWSYERGKERGAPSGTILSAQALSGI